METGFPDPSKDKIPVHIDPDLKAFIPTYLGKRKKEVEGIRKALRKNDLASIQNFGHTMRGSGGGYGFDFISAIGADRENAAKAQDKDKIKISVEKL